MKCFCNIEFRSELDEIVDPLINPKQEADKYNCVIDLLDRFKKVINVGQRAKYLILKVITSEKTKKITKFHVIRKT